MFHKKVARVTANNEKQRKIIVRGHQPTTDLDSSKPPQGESVVTKQLKEIRQMGTNLSIISIRTDSK